MLEFESANREAEFSYFPTLEEPLGNRKQAVLWAKEEGGKSTSSSAYPEQLRTVHFGLPIYGTSIEAEQDKLAVQSSTSVSRNGLDSAPSGVASKMETVEPGVPSLSGLVLVDKHDVMNPSSPQSGDSDQLSLDLQGDLHQSGDASRLSKKDALPLVLQWIKENYEADSNSCIPKHLVYQHYKEFCEGHNIQHTNMANFGKIIRSVFPRLKTRRLGPRGKTKHHYHGICVSSKSALQVPVVISGRKVHRRARPANAVSTNNVPAKRQCRGKGESFEDEGVPRQEVKAIPVLPSFDLNGFSYGNNEELLSKARNFLHLYKQHSQQLITVMCQYNFAEFERLVARFWGQLGELSEVLLYEDMANLIGEKDRLVYNMILDFFFPSLLEPLARELTESLLFVSKHFKIWVENNSRSLPGGLAAKKLQEAKRFALSLRKRSRLSLLAQQVREVFRADVRPQMLLDWNGVEFDIILDKAFLGCPDGLLSSGQSIAFTITDDIKNLLYNQNTTEECIEWLRDIADNFIGNMLQPAAGNSVLSGLVFTSEQLLYNWSLYTSLIMRDLTCRDASSLEAFHLLFTLFNAFLAHYTESRILHYKITSAKTTLPARPISSPHTTPRPVGSPAGPSGVSIVTTSATGSPAQPMNFAPMFTDRNTAMRHQPEQTGMDTLSDMSGGMYMASPKVPNGTGQGSPVQQRLQAVAQPQSQQQQQQQQPQAQHFDAVAQQHPSSFALFLDDEVLNVDLPPSLYQGQNNNMLVDTDVNGDSMPMFQARGGWK